MGKLKEREWIEIKVQLETCHNRLDQMVVIRQLMENVYTIMSRIVYTSHKENIVCPEDFVATDAFILFGWRVPLLFSGVWNTQWTHTVLDPQELQVWEEGQTSLQADVVLSAVMVANTEGLGPCGNSFEIGVLLNL